MALFGKNKNEDFDEEEIEEKEDRKLTKKFRDLNPKNKKKRKEPPKPWGKRERFLVLAIFVVTVFASAFLAISSRTHVSLNFSKFPTLTKIDFSSFGFFKEETIEIKKR